METLKYYVKVVAVRSVILTLSVFYSSLVAVGILVKWAIKGKEYWHVKERTLPPLILQDAAWGRHSYINLKDIKLHYVENGDRSKPLMLFVHGFPEFWFSWRHQMKHFAKDYWVVALDMRGYGDSDKPKGVSSYKVDLLTRDIHDLVKGLQKNKCVLVGHDWGGLVCWSVAMSYPEIVDNLIILNCPHPAAFKAKLEKSLKQFVKSWYIFAFQLPYLPEMYFRTQDLEVFRDIFENKLTEEELEAFKFNWAKPGAFTPPINYYRNVLDASQVISPPKYPKIMAPTLIIWGENDLALEKDMPELCRPYVDKIQIQYIPDCNHFCQQDKPGLVNEYMEKYLKGR